MSSFAGLDAVIQIGSDVIGEMKNFSHSNSWDTADTTTFGATAKAKTKKPTLREGTLDFSGFLDPDDTGQAAVLAAMHAAEATGLIAAMSLYPFGVAAGTLYTGAFVVKSCGISGSYDGMVEVNFSLETNGAITYTP